MSGRSQSRSSSFTLQFRWRTGCRVRRHWNQPDHHPDGLQPQPPAPRADQYGQRVRPRVIDLLVGEIIVTLTYVTLVMRADNDGGGSIMTLITLLRRYGGARGRRTAMTLAALGLVGATVFFGESMITPAISPGSDQDSLNRAVRAVLADGGSVLIIDERVADAFAAPADDLERYHYAWAGGRDVVGPGTTIQRDPRDGEPWVRAAMFSQLEATRDRGRELAAGGKGKP